MRRKIGLLSLIIGCLTLIVWAISRYLVPLFPADFQRDFLFIFAVLVTVMGVLASLKDILELVSTFFEKDHMPQNDFLRHGYVGNNTFILHLTKAQFERELDKLVNKSHKSVLIPWRILRRRRTERERKMSSQMDENNRNWEIVTNISDADAIKLTSNQYHGIVLELTEKENSLWVVIHAEGERESITVFEDGLFRHKGYKFVPVNPESQQLLFEWLKNECTQNDNTVS